MQEMVTLRLKNVILDSRSRMRPWLLIMHKLIDRGHKKDSSYVLLMTKHLVGLMLAVFVRKDIRRFITDEEKGAIGCGTGGVGNKGAVAIRLRLFNTSFCFVNAHLAAHREHFDQRNADYRRIINKLQFKSEADDGSRKRTRTSVSNHDHTFFVGDLNYRLSLSNDKLWMVYSNISRRDWNALLPHDQLLAAKKHDVFAGFQEGSICFPPTFKYTPSTEDYATGDGKNRMPAWCDRILWKSMDPSSVKQHFYDSVSGYALKSDHKPVFSCFAVKVKVPDPKRQAEEFERIKTLMKIRKAPRGTNHVLRGGSRAIGSSQKKQRRPVSPMSDSAAFGGRRLLYYKSHAKLRHVDVDTDESEESDDTPGARSPVDTLPAVKSKKETGRIGERVTSA
mmetsp:Transcript_19843/g.48556  ORF Transcript_19843/g.48556 Transcript_19843/m.48556 type:complete len:393 (-) Transcript_19843:365-1543(-)